MKLVQKSDLLLSETVKLLRCIVGLAECFCFHMAVGLCKIIGTIVC